MTTCFKGWERSKHNYRDYEGAEMDSYASTDSDAFSMKKPTLIISIGDRIDDVKEFYRDFQILKDGEAGSHKSVKTTFDVAHKYFLNYLGDVDVKEMESHLFCTISGDIMLFPVKTNCNHVFELLSITNSLKRSERCPLCKKKVKELAFDLKTMATIRYVVRDALVELRKSAGNQNLLLLQKQFKITKFSHLDEITRAKIKNKTPLSLAEKRTLYHIFSEYSKTFASINSYMEKSLRMILEETHYKKKIDDVQFGELTKQLQEHFK